MISIMRFLKAPTPKGWRIKMLSAYLPAFAQSCYAAVILITSFLIKHACMHNMPNWHIQVIWEEILQILQGLVSCGLQELKGGESQISRLSHTNPVGQFKIASMSWPKFFRLVMIVTLMCRAQQGTRVTYCRRSNSIYRPSWYFCKLGLRQTKSNLC